MTAQGQTDPTAWQEKMFRLLAENVREYAIFLVDPQGRVLTWSPGAQQKRRAEPDRIRRSLPAVSSQGSKSSSGLCPGALRMGHQIQRTPRWLSRWTTRAICTVPALSE